MFPWRPGTVPKLWTVRPLLNFSRATSAKVQVRSHPDFSISFNNFTGRMKMCFFMNEKFQLLDLAAEISKKPSHEECSLTVDPSRFPLAHPIKWGSAGFQMGCSQEGHSRGKTKEIFLPGVGEKSHPRLKGYGFFFSLGALKKHTKQT